MKKQTLIVLAVMILVFGLTSIPSMAADKCINWGYKWDGDTDYIYTYTWLFEDGTFATAEGNSGNWEKFGGSFMLQYTDGCQPLYAGTKRQGFFACTDGTGAGGTNYYMIKGTNKKNCAAAMPILTPPASVKEGRSGCSPD